METTNPTIRLARELAEITGAVHASYNGGLLDVAKLLVKVATRFHTILSCGDDDQISRAVRMVQADVDVSAFLELDGRMLLETIVKGIREKDLELARTVAIELGTLHASHSEWCRKLDLDLLRNANRSHTAILAAMEAFGVLHVVG